MWLRPGNLVRHKSGGPIMMIEAAPPEGVWLVNPDFECHCIWVEDRVRKGGVFRVSHLQSVYADGSPRNYDSENHGLVAQADYRWRPNAISSSAN